MPQSGWTSEHDAEQQKWVTEDYTRRIDSHDIHHQSIHKESRSVGAWGGGRRQSGEGRTGFLLGAGYTIFWFHQKNSDLHNLNGWTNMPYVIALVVETNLEKSWRVNLNWVIAFIRPACEQVREAFSWFLMDMGGLSPLGVWANCPGASSRSAGSIPPVGSASSSCRASLDDWLSPVS